MIRFLFIILTCSLALAAQSHRQHFAFSEVVLSDNGTTLQITHRFHEHDAAEWLRQLSGTRVDITELKQQAYFAIYVEDQFRITLAGVPLGIETLGAELDGPWLFVYQEAAVGQNLSSLSELSFSGRILMPMLPDQIHRIDVRLGDLVGSAELTQRKQGVPPIPAS